MSVPAPHFLLFSASEAERRRRHETNEPAGGRWHFLLESLHGPDRLEATDEEIEAEGERLELLAVVRGLEALDQPSRVTLVTPSTYVSRGLRYGLESWQESNWEWESFGRMVPVKNRDLWQRVHRAMHYHEVECRTWRFDNAGGNEGNQRAADDVGPAGTGRDLLDASAHRSAEENNDRGTGDATAERTAPRPNLARRMAARLAWLCGRGKPAPAPPTDAWETSDTGELATA